MSYNGYYVSFPRTRREFDSLHLHQLRKNALLGRFFVFDEIDNMRRGDWGDFLCFLRKIE